MALSPPRNSLRWMNEAVEWFDAAWEMGPGFSGLDRVDHYQPGGDPRVVQVCVSVTVAACGWVWDFA
jgi:hypothetical protein